MGERVTMTHRWAGGRQAAAGPTRRGTASRSRTPTTRSGSLQRRSPMRVRI